MPNGLAECQQFPLNFFEEHLPDKPYFTDDLFLGLRIRKKTEALKARYIQANGPTHLYWLVFDLDLCGAALHWDHVDAPAPNITVKNPENGHAHLIYGLVVPVRTAPDGKSTPLRYAASVENALREKLSADPGYSGLICKNPLHTHWQVKEWEPYLYTLDWLADYLDLTPYADKRKRMPEYGLGRNCTLFERTRLWSYRAIRQGWPDYDQWLKAVEQRATGYNLAFEQPLSLPEVKHTAKSIAKWVYKEFSPEGFSQWQARQGRKGGKAKGKAYADKRAQAQQMRAEGMTQQAIADVLGVNRVTVNRWLNSRM